MRIVKYTLMLFVVISLMTVSPAIAAAQAGSGSGDDSLTLTLDRKYMPKTIFYPGLLCTDADTITVHEYVIRDHLGKPIDGFIIQTASGQTLVPVEKVKEISFEQCIRHKTRDIDHVYFVEDARMVLTSGKEMSVIMNADFGTVEGKTKLGDFFLGDPHTVKKLVFNREAAAEPEPAPPAAPGPQEPAPQEARPVTPPEVDSDGDGVPDSRDKCPDTPKGAKVTEEGCWTIKGVNFDYNKWDIKPEYFSVMDENVRVLLMNPTMEIEIQGHTDSIASEKYNQWLSEKRANSAKEYFVSKDVNEKRITTRGFGETRPIVSNDTPEGRAKNRRIEIMVTNK
jgi:outer membrane protein OmpA-like peptidoglycan-associated protein